MYDLLCVTSRYLHRIQKILKVFSPSRKDFILMCKWLLQLAIVRKHRVKISLVWVTSRAARGGGGARAPHWPEKYAKSHVLGAFEAEFCSKHENSIPQRDLGAEVVKELPCCGQKNAWNLRFRTKKPSQFRWQPFFFFFWDHLILGGKNLWFWNYPSPFRSQFSQLSKNAPPPPPPLNEILATRLWVTAETWFCWVESGDNCAVNLARVRQ